MRKFTRILLRITFVAIALLLPAIVIICIIRDGSWWMLGFLVWGAAIELFILVLLGRAKAIGDMPK